MDDYLEEPFSFKEMVLEVKKKTLENGDLEVIYLFDKKHSKMVDHKLKCLTTNDRAIAYYRDKSLVAPGKTYNLLDVCCKSIDIQDTQDTGWRTATFVIKKEHIDLWEAKEKEIISHFDEIKYFESLPDAESIQI